MTRGLVDLSDRLRRGLRINTNELIILSTTFTKFDLQKL